MMIDVREITQLHADAVGRWHSQEIDNPHSSLLEVVCRQHQQNFRLWHQEDIARSPDMSDSDLAAVIAAWPNLSAADRERVVTIIRQGTQGGTEGGA